MIQRIFLDGSCKDGVILQIPKNVESYLKESCKKKSDLLETFLARNFPDCGISCNILASFCQKNSLSCQIFPQNFQNFSVFSLTLGFLMRNFAELLQSLVLQDKTLLAHTFPRLQKKLCFWQNFPKNGYFPKFLQIFFQKIYYLAGSWKKYIELWKFYKKLLYLARILFEALFPRLGTSIGKRKKL